MPLATSVLIENLTTRIKDALDQPFDEKSSSDDIKKRFAQNLATAIGEEVDTWIKTGQVTTPAGVAVQVTPTSGTGATTAPGIGTIS